MTTMKESSATLALALTAWRKTSAALLLCMALMPAIVQTSLQATAQQASLIFQNLNSSDGLCSNYVRGLAQDHRGCLWVATEAGLARFDGSRFTTFRQGSSPICSDELNDVFYHPATRQLWIASQRDGISVYDVDRQAMTAHFTSDNGLMTNDVTHLGQAADGGIWVTHYHLGVEHYDPATGRFTHYDARSVRGLSNLRSWVSCDDGRGHLLIGHEGGGMSLIDLRTRRLTRYAYHPDNALKGGIPGATVHAILVDRNGRYWVGTSQGLALFDLRTGRFTTFRHRADQPGSILSDKVMSIGQRRNGDIWVCTDMGGVSILPAGKAPSETAFTNIASANGLSSSSPYDFLEDSFGNVWIGNYRSGLDYAAHMHPIFTTLPYTQTHFDRLTYNPVWGLAFDPSGRLWMGSEDELCALVSDMPNTRVPLGNVGNNVHVNTIYRAPDGTLWLGLYNRGVAFFAPDAQRITLLPMPFAQGDLSVNCFLQGTDRLWVGTEQGLCFLKDGQVVPHTRVNAQMADLMVRSLVADRFGQLWIGTFGRGIYVVNAQGRVVAHIEKGSGLLSNAINQLLLARDGSVWAATRKGLAHFADPRRPARVQVMDHTQGLIEDHVHAIAQDSEGNIWLSTNAHIARYHVRRASFDNFAARLGVPTGDFVNGSVAQAPDGTLYFGSLAGVCRFSPAAFRHLPKQAPVQIVGLMAYSAPTGKGDSIRALALNQSEVRVPYDQNTVRLTFNVADVAQSPLTEYAYRVLEFADGQWLSTQGEDYVTFRDLAPGTYNVSIRSRMPGQDWNPHTATLRIVVEPPFWLAWYAKLLYALLFIGIIWWFMRSYKHKTDLESRLRIEHHRHMNDVALNQERLRFYTNITHELRTPLTLIVGPLDDLSADNALPPVLKTRLTGIRSAANRLLGLVNELLEFRKTETQNRRLRVVHADLAQEVKGIVVHFKELNRKPEVDIRTEWNEQESFLQWFDPEILRIVLDNFLSNALKYTPKGEICISLAHETETLTADPASEQGSGETTGTAPEQVRRTVLRVTDTGYGIPQESLPHLFQRYYQAGGPHQVAGSGIGLALVKSVAELHHAQVSAANREEGGSVFSFALPTDDTYSDAERATNAASPTLAGTHAPAETADAPAEAPANAPAQEENLPTLLVVEDNAELRDYIRQSLHTHFRVVEAADGQQGLERAREKQPDVVLTDVMMPIMDGYELCRRLKGDVNTSHIPVILLTAKDLMQDKAEGYAAGADSYLTKPFSARLLLSRINNLLQVRRQLAQLIAQRMAVPPAESATGAAATPQADTTAMPQSQAGATGAIEAGAQPAAPNATAPNSANPNSAISESAPQLSPIDQRFLSKLDNFVLTHLQEEKLDVGYIASEMCMSHSTLYRKVKALIGISVNEYVRRTRLRRAAELLNQGNCTIAEVADRTGFSTPSYFRQCFKDAYGLTPSDYASGKRPAKP